MRARQCACAQRSAPRVVQAAGEADFSMPADLRLERAAFTKCVGFAHVGAAQDAIARQDDAKRQANRQSAVRRARGMLDGQMAEVERSRVRGPQTRCTGA